MKILPILALILMHLPATGQQKEGKGISDKPTSKGYNRLIPHHPPISIPVHYPAAAYIHI